MMSLRTKLCLGILAAFSIIILASIYDYGRRGNTYVLETTLVESINKDSHLGQIGQLKYKPSTAHSFADMTMAERKQFVAKRCSEVKKWIDKKESNNARAVILYDKEHNIMACNNHKAGSTTIFTIFKNLSHLQDKGVFRRKHLKQSFSPRLINNSSAKTFMFVREPLQRLMSAYGNGAYVRQNHTTHGKVPFATFLEDILKVRDRRYVNIHVLSYFHGCRPCDVEYDYIGAMETFDEDLKYILQQSSIDIDRMPHSNNHKRPDSGEIIKNVPMDIKVKIWERYKEDYFIFGYPHPINGSYTVR